MSYTPKPELPNTVKKAQERLLKSVKTRVKAQPQRHERRLLEALIVNLTYQPETLLALYSELLDQMALNGEAKEAVDSYAMSTLFHAVENYAVLCQAAFAPNSVSELAELEGIHKHSAERKAKEAEHRQHQQMEERCRYLTELALEYRVRDWCDMADQAGEKAVAEASATSKGDTPVTARAKVLEA